MEKAKTLMETWGYEEGSMAHLWLLEGEERGKEIGKEIGKELGKELGREEALRQSITRMLGRGITLADAADLLGIPLELADRLAAPPLGQ
ncbi:MAG: hypothetical protein NW241_01775 [Bacteroidia bacterium]|nr:hypothetical protein [Bacteroidia bacterium]